MKDLTTVEFSEGLVKIGESAFEGCSKLDNIVLPESLRSLDSSAFQGATELKNVTISEGLLSIFSVFKIVFANAKSPNSLKDCGNIIFDNFEQPSKA